MDDPQTVFLGKLIDRLAELEKTEHKSVELLLDRMERVESRQRGCNNHYH